MADDWMVLESHSEGPAQDASSSWVVVSDPSHYCSVCNRWLRDLEDLQNHGKGPSHKKRVALAKQRALEADLALMKDELERHPMFLSAKWEAPGVFPSDPKSESETGGS